MRWQSGQFGEFGRPAPIPLLKLVRSMRALPGRLSAHARSLHNCAQIALPQRPPRQKFAGLSSLDDREDSDRAKKLF
jgi:hypothetical protein